MAMRCLKNNWYGECACSKSCYAPGPCKINSCDSLRPLSLDKFGLSHTHYYFKETFKFNSLSLVFKKNLKKNISWLYRTSLTNDGILDRGQIFWKMVWKYGKTYACFQVTVLFQWCFLVFFIPFSSPVWKYAPIQYGVINREVLYCME